MSFVAGAILNASQLNDLDIDSLVVDTDTLVVDKTNDRVGIGTTSPAAELDVAGKVSITGGNVSHTIWNQTDVGLWWVTASSIRMGVDGDATNPSSNDQWVYFRRGDNTALGAIQGTGSASVNFSTTSDATLKTDNGLVTEERIGSIMDTLQVHDFDWNEGTVTEQIGLFAQEAIDVLPESIVAPPGEDDAGEYLPASLDYSKIVPILIAELQFLRQRVEALELAR